MNALGQIFASKLPPDNTINRIDALEKRTKSLSERLDQVEKHPNILFVDLKVRIEILEKDLKAIHDLNPAAKFSALDSSLNALNLLIKGLGSSTSGDNSNLDTNAIMMRIGLLTDELSKKADKI